jgi:hypothetical protein
MWLMPDNGRPATTLTTLTEAVTLVLATAGLVYVLGGVVLMLRLWFAGLPAQSTVAQLPKELVIAVGLSEVIGPALIAGLLTAVVLIVGPFGLLLRKDSLSQSSHKARVRLITIGAVVAVLAPGTVRAAVSYDLDAKSLTYLVAVLSAVIAVVAARMIINDTLKDTASEGRTKPELGRGYLTPGPLLRMSACGAALVGIAALIFVGGRAMVPVAVCMEGGDSRRGYLIGEASNRFYIGLGVDYRDTKNARDDDEAVLSIGDDRVKRVVYGKGVAERKRGCPDARDRRYRR